MKNLQPSSRLLIVCNKAVEALLREKLSRYTQGTGHLPRKTYEAANPSWTTSLAPLVWWAPATDRHILPYVTVKLLNTFRTKEQSPHSSRLCSHRQWNEAFVPRILLLLSWKTQPNWNKFQNKLPSNKGREHCHFLLHCFDVQIGKNMMASQRNISFWSIGHILSMDFDNEHKDGDRWWMGAWFWTNWGEGEWSCVKQWRQHCNVNCQNVSIFIGFVLLFFSGQYVNEFFLIFSFFSWHVVDIVIFRTRRLYDLVSRCGLAVRR